jgi:alginate O-acetyltransferase complex protein AlgI
MAHPAVGAACVGSLPRLARPMVFSSIEFLWFFMPAVLGLYAIVPPRGRNALLVLVSLVFYAWGAHAVVFVLIASVAFNYGAGLLIGHFGEAGRDAAVRRTMIAAIVVDLLVLFGWKYTVFAANQLDSVVGLFGSGSIPIPSILLPIGISFFTFHGISYLVDCARGDARPMRNPVDYAQYMVFFPQLIAGPIIRYKQIADQIRTPPPRRQRLEDLTEGFPRFALGLCKKVLIADQVAPIADAAFGNAGGLNSTAAWVGALAYTLQIYFDFSGYSDMAIGLARMFGFRFPENFDRPYTSVSMTDFWRRWHITLSRWFRDYVYIPMGGSRGSQAQTSRNLMFVFLLVGFWHGAGWTFLLWGAYNGTLLVIERLTGVSRLADDFHPIPRRAGTFVLAVLGWVVFRAATLGDAGRIYGALFSFDFGPLPSAVADSFESLSLVAFCVGLACVLLPRGPALGPIVDRGWSGASLPARLAVMAARPLAAITVAAGSFSPFLYYQF